jgi:hypothetical protein
MRIPDADPGDQNHADPCGCGCGSSTLLTTVVYIFNCYFFSALSVKSYKKIHDKKVEKFKAKLKAQTTNAERCDIKSLFKPH